MRTEGSLFIRQVSLTAAGRGARSGIFMRDGFFCTLFYNLWGFFVRRATVRSGRPAKSRVVLIDPNGGPAPTCPRNLLSAEVDALGISIRTATRSLPDSRQTLPWDYFKAIRHPDRITIQPECQPRDDTCLNPVARYKSGIIQ